MKLTRRQQLEVLKNKLKAYDPDGLAEAIVESAEHYGPLMALICKIKRVPHSTPSPVALCAREIMAGIDFGISAVLYFQQFSTHLITATRSRWWDANCLQLMEQSSTSINAGIERVESGIRLLLGLAAVGQDTSSNVIIDIPIGSQFVNAKHMSARDVVKKLRQARCASSLLHYMKQSQDLFTWLFDQEPETIFVLVSHLQWPIEDIHNNFYAHMELIPHEQLNRLSSLWNLLPTKRGVSPYWARLDIYRPWFWYTNAYNDEVYRAYKFMRLSEELAWSGVENVGPSIENVLKCVVPLASSIDNLNHSSRGAVISLKKFAQSYIDATKEIVNAAECELKLHIMLSGEPVESKPVITAISFKYAWMSEDFALGAKDALAGLMSHWEQAFVKVKVAWGHFRTIRRDYDRGYLVDFPSVKHIVDGQVFTSPQVQEIVSDYSTAFYDLKTSVKKYMKILKSNFTEQTPHTFDTNIDYNARVIYPMSSHQRRLRSIINNQHRLNFKSYTPDEFCSMVPSCNCVSLVSMHQWRRTRPSQPNKQDNPNTTPHDKRRSKPVSSVHSKSISSTKAESTAAGSSGQNQSSFAYGPPPRNRSYADTFEGDWSF